MHTQHLEHAPFRPASIYRILQHPTRLHLLNAVHMHSPVSFNALVLHLDLSPLALRHHLAQLEEAGLLRFRKTPFAQAGEELIVFRPVGWARLKRAWHKGMQAL